MFSKVDDCPCVRLPDDLLTSLDCVEHCRAASHVIANCAAMGRSEATRTEHFIIV